MTDPVFPALHIRWLPVGGPKSAYAISYEAEMAKVWAAHPDWVRMLRWIEADSLMTEARWRAVRAERQDRLARRKGW